MAEGHISGRGGARVGAGRKPKSDRKWTVAITVRLSDRGAEILQRAAERAGKSRQHIINDLVESLELSPEKRILGH